GPGTPPPRAAPPAPSVSAAPPGGRSGQGSSRLVGCPECWEFCPWALSHSSATSSRASCSAADRAAWFLLQGLGTAADLRGASGPVAALCCTFRGSRPREERARNQSHRTADPPPRPTAIRPVPPNPRAIRSSPWTGRLVLVALPMQEWPRAFRG